MSRASRIAVIAWLALAACGSSSPPPPAEREREPHARCTVALRFEDGDEGASEESAESEIALPHTRVTLVRICEPGGTETRVVGTEVGVCMHADAGGALLRARCWWAGEGSEIAVHQDRSELVVRRASWDETTGRAAWTEVLDLALPRNAEVHALGPDTLPAR